MYIRKLRYPWRHLKVKTPARIGLSPSFVKFGLVRPDQANFVETVPKFDRKPLKMVIAFSNMYSCITISGKHKILKTGTGYLYRVPIPSTGSEYRAPSNYRDSNLPIY
jgi:hypothetical protein